MILGVHKQLSTAFGLVNLPLLVPSFSSRAIQNVGDAVVLTQDLLWESVLVSAFDVHYHGVANDLAFTELCILDSGGYEKLPPHATTDPYRAPPADEDWNQDLYCEVLRNWAPSTSTIVVSYDMPKERVPLSDQISRAQTHFVDAPDKALRCLLIKPAGDNKLIQVDEVLKHVPQLADFDVIGFTEKELGSSLVEKIRTVALLRKSLDACELDIPIHIFGCLDPLTTPLYAFAGADIFDGLSWLRFLFTDAGLAVYLESAPVVLDINLRGDQAVRRKVWMENLMQMQRIQRTIRQAVSGGSFANLGPYQGTLEKIYNAAIERLQPGGK